jgi:type VI secretion system protein ImpC
MAELETQVEAQAEAPAEAVGEFTALLEREFKPRSDTAREAVQDAVKTLAAQALEHTTLISGETLDTIEAIIAEIDRKLSEQVNLIMHHEDFQQLESAWRGLHYLVTNTETDEMLKIRVMNITKNEVRKTLKKYKGVAWDQSPLFKQIYEHEYGTFGGEPFGCLVAIIILIIRRPMWNSSGVWRRSQRRRIVRLSPRLPPR